MDKRIKRIIAETIGCQEEEVVEHRILINDLGMDDLDRAELVIALEDELVIPILNEDADKWETVKDVIDCVERTLKG